MPKSIAEKIRQQDSAYAEWTDDEILQAVQNKYGTANLADLSLDKIRKSSSFYDDWSDDELSKALHEKYAPYLDLKDFQSRIGMDTIGKAESFGQGGLQGFTFGFGDELSGAMGAAVSPIERVYGDKIKEWSTLDEGGGIGDKMKFATAQLLKASPFGAPFQLASNTGSAEDRAQRFEQALSEVDPENPSALGLMSSLYQKSRDVARGNYERAQREHPGMTMAGELTGGLASAAAGGGLGTATKLASSGRLLPAAMKMGAEGTKLGAISGYGFSDYDPLAAILDDNAATNFKTEAIGSLIDTTIGGTFGGATGMAIPSIGAGVRNLTRRFLQPISGTMKRAMLNEEGRRIVADAVMEDLSLGNLTADAAQRELRETPGLLVGDLGRNTRNLLDRIAQSATPASAQVEQALEQRATGAYGRIMPTVAKALGSGGSESNFVRLSKNILGEAQEKAAPLYEEAYQQVVPIPQRLLKLLERPAAKAGMRRAQTLLREEGRNVDLALPNVPNQNVPVETLDSIIRGLDGHVNSLFKKGQGDIGTAAKKTRDAIREIVYDLTKLDGRPGPLQQARQIWSSSKADEEALDMGLRVLRDDADFTRDLIAGMTESERTHFRIGALRAIERVMKNVGDQPGAVQDITKKLTKDKAKREAIEAAFGNRRRFDEFMNLMDKERKMFETFSAAVGNSKTAKRLAQAEAGADIGGIIGMGSTAGLLPDASLYAYSAGRKLGRKGQEAILGDTMRANFAARNAQQANLLLGNDLNQVFRPQSPSGILRTGAPASGLGLTQALLRTNLMPGMAQGEYGGHKTGLFNE